MACFALSSSLAVLLAAAPVSIYIGPQVRDGFVDVDQGVRDSIADVTKELRKNQVFSVVSDEASATLKLYVVRRHIDGSGPSVVIGSSTQGAAGTAIAVPIKTRTLETMLRVGAYERTFVAEDRDYDSWGKCAQRIAKDLSVWLAANRDRLTEK